jgi:hypothetical protein
LTSAPNSSSLPAQLRIIVLLTRSSACRSASSASSALIRLWGRICLPLFPHRRLAFATDAGYAVTHYRDYGTAGQLAEVPVNKEGNEIKMARGSRGTSVETQLAELEMRHHKRLKNLKDPAKKLESEREFVRQRARLEQLLAMEPQEAREERNRERRSSPQPDSEALFQRLLFLSWLYGIRLPALFAAKVSRAILRISGLDSLRKTLTLKAWQQPQATKATVDGQKERGSQRGKADIDHTSDRQPSQMNWYRASDARRKLRQIVIELPTAGAVGPRFGSLMLTARYEDLFVQTWNAGYFQMAWEQEPYLLVRADGYVDKLRECGLRLAFSFYRGRVGGLFGLFVAAKSPELDRAAPTKRALVECIYGLDMQHTVDLIHAGLARDSAHICFADASTNVRINVIDESGKSREYAAPACRFDRVYSMPADCQRALDQEFRQLLHYHRNLAPSKRNYRASVEELSGDFPPASDPILAQTEQSPSAAAEHGDKRSFRQRLLGLWQGPAAAATTLAPQVLPFEQFEHAMIFVKGPATNFQLSDAVQRVLEEMTGR